MPADAPAPLGVIVVASDTLADSALRLRAARELARGVAGFCLVLAAEADGPESAAYAGLFAPREALESGLPWRTVTFAGDLPPGPGAAEALLHAAGLGDPEVIVRPPAGPSRPDTPPPSHQPPLHLQHAPVPPPRPEAGFTPEGAPR